MKGSVASSLFSLSGWFGLLVIINACAAPGTRVLPDLSDGDSTGVFSTDTIATHSNGTATGSFDSEEILDLSVSVVIVDQARRNSLVQTAVASAVRIYEKCRINLQVNISELAVAPDLVISKDVRYELANQFSAKLPAVFVVPATTEHEVAYAYLPSFESEVSATAWLTNRISDGCFAWIMAHEIGHILMNSGAHSAGSKNVMSNNCKSSNWGSGTLDPDWTHVQCIALRGSEFIEAIALPS